MREQGDSLEDMELMQSRLRIRWREDDPSVPPGWKTRTSQIRSKVSCIPSVGNSVAEPVHL